MAQDCPHCSLCLIPAVEGLQHSPSVQSFWNSRSSACWRETQQELEIFDPSNGVALLAIVWDMVHGAWGVRAARPGVLSPGSHEDTAGRAGMLLQPVSLSCRGKGQPSPGGCSWGALLHHVERLLPRPPPAGPVCQRSRGHAVVSVSLEELARGWPWGQACAVTAGLCSPAAAFTTSDPFLIICRAEAVQRGSSRGENTCSGSWICSLKHQTTFRPQLQGVNAVPSFSAHLPPPVLTGSSGRMRNHFLQ